MGHSSRRLSVLLVVCVLSLLFVVLLPVLAQMRDASRRGQCLANLRDLSQAVRAYHGVHNALPPLATDAEHWTWLALVMPHLPDVGDIGQPDLHRPALSDGNVEWLARARSARLYCPTRRNGAVEPAGLSGQSSDYAAVSTTAPLFWSLQSGGPLVIRAAPPTATEPVRSRTKLSDVIDGESLTALIGEKRLRPDWLWGSYDQPALIARNDPNTVRIASNIEVEPIRGIIEEHPRGLVNDSSEDNDPFKFGGPHPGVCFFAMVDGSARPVKNSVDPMVLRWLSGRHDRTPVLLD